LAKFSSLKQTRLDQGYLWFPTSAFRHYWLQTQNFDQILKQVYQPTLIIQSKNDKVAKPSGALHILKTIPAHDKQIIWLEKSGHEMLLDIEAQTVINHLLSFKPLFG
jgi:carboxylesterase